MKTLVIRISAEVEGDMPVWELADVLDVLVETVESNPKVKRRSVIASVQIKGEEDAA